MTSAAGDDPFDEFWALFGAELDDYLGTIEEILATTPVDLGRVDELFRAFHSVKGGSAALALRCIEKVAHAAEDVLHQVRAGKRTLTTEVVSTLLEAVDEMRRLQDTAMATRQDQPINDAIVARLKAHLGAGSGAGSGTGPAPVSATAPEVVPAMDADLMAAFAALGAAGDDGGQAAPLEPEPVAVAEPVLVLAPEALAGLQDGVLGLVGVVDGEPAMAIEELGLLADSADKLGLLGLAKAARRVTQASGDGVWEWQDLLARLRAVETATGESLGAFALAASLEIRLGELLAEQVASLKTLPGDIALWLRAVRLLAVLELDTAVELADTAVTRLLLDEAPSAEMAEADEAAADLFALAGISLASGIEPPRAELAALRDARFGLAGVASSDGPAPAPGGTYPWPGDVLARLSTEMTAGRTPLLVLLDLESPSPQVQAVCELLFGTHCLYNRSRLDLGGGLFEYLLAVDGPAEAFFAVVAEADPEQAVVRTLSVADVRALPVAPASDVPPVAAALPAPALPAPSLAAPPPPPSPAPSSAPLPAIPPTARAADPMVRVPSAAVDGFMDLIGEMRLGLTALGMVMDTTGTDDRIQDEFNRLERTVRALYDGAIALRVVPIGTLFNRLLRPVRDTAVLVGKPVSLSTAGEDVQVDKAMIEMLVDPLTHIVRNSVDHGIEAPDVRAAAGKPAEGSIRIHARQGASMAVIAVEDDGAGIDVKRVRDKAVAKGLIGRAEADALPDEEAIQLILLPGFSTRDEVTATSGRGVGMDIVVTAIKKLGGRLTIDSALGRGTRMVIEFPISAAMQRVVTTTVAGQPIALHERTVHEVVHVARDRLQRIGRRMTLSLRNTFLPVVDLASLLGFEETAPASGQAVVIVVDDGDEQLGLLIDRMARRQEVFFKKLHPLIERNPLIAGAAVNGSGGVLFALDTPAVVKKARRWLEP